MRRSRTAASLSIPRQCFLNVRAAPRALEQRADIVHQSETKPGKRGPCGFLRILARELLQLPAIALTITPTALLTPLSVQARGKIARPFASAFKSAFTGKSKSVGAPLGVCSGERVGKSRIVLAQRACLQRLVLRGHRSSLPNGRANIIRHGRPRSA